MAEYTPADAPWPVEEVWPRDLRVGDVINIAGNFPWLQVTQMSRATIYRKINDYGIA